MNDTITIDYFEKTFCSVINGEDSLNKPLIPGRRPSPVSINHIVER